MCDAVTIETSSINLPITPLQRAISSWFHRRPLLQVPRRSHSAWTSTISFYLLCKMNTCWWLGCWPEASPDEGITRRNGSVERGGGEIAGSSFQVARLAGSPAPRLFRLWEDEGPADQLYCAASQLSKFGDATSVIPCLYPISPGAGVAEALTSFLC